MDRRRAGGPSSTVQKQQQQAPAGGHDGPNDDDDDDGGGGGDGVDDGDRADATYRRLVDAGVLDDVRALAESIVSCSSVSSRSQSPSRPQSPSSAAGRARLIADRLLEQNADDVERALDAVVRDAGLADGGPRTPAHFRSWPGLLPALGPGRPARDAARALRALARLPFAGGDTYAGPHFRRLTAGLERAVCADATFEPAARVYARLVAAAPDAETAAETFASLCAAAHMRCARRGGGDRGGPAAADPAKSVAAVRLAARCLRDVCARCAAHPKHVKPAVVEFAAAIAADADRERSAYAILCCADPAAAWFDPVAKRWSARAAFFQCLDGDRRLLKAVVSSFVRWMAEPDVPPPLPPSGPDKRCPAAVVRYACALHAVHLLAKMLRYRDAAALFPVKVRCRATRVHVATVADYCVAFLQSVDRVGRAPATLARGLCALLAAVAAARPDVFDSLVAAGGGPAASLPVEFRARALADTVRLCPAAVRGREQSVDEIFARRHWKDARADDGALRSLTVVAAALASRHDGVWRLVTGRMAFLEAAAAAADDASADCGGGGGGGDDDFRSLMAVVRGTPLASFTYHLRTAREDVFDWADPRDRLLVGVACAAAGPGDDWLRRVRASDSLNALVESRLEEAAASLDSEDSRPVESVVDVAYACCASIGGLKFLLDYDQRNDGSNTVGIMKTITELYHFSYEQFDSHQIARDVLVMLWLRLIEAATHSFSLRVYAEFKLNYQDLLTKLSAEKRTEDGTVFVDETTELLTKLQRPVLPAVVPCAETVPSVLTEFLANDDHGAGWLQTARAMVIRSDQISGTETIDLIISYGRRRFDGQLDVDASTDHKSNLTDFDVAGIRLAMRYGSSVGLVAEDSSSGLERLYGGCERPGSSSPGLFDCVTCTLFIASGGSANKCAEARAVLSRLAETTRFAWPSEFGRGCDDDDDDDDRRAAFGHLVEGLLQQELPEVYNAFKMSGVSWWLLCSGWASDCFWGRLSWPETCRWLCLVALSATVDYQAFYFVCVAAARKRRWLEAFNSGRFREAVYQENFGDFRLVDHADYLEDLAKKYHRFVSKRLASEFGTP